MSPTRPQARPFWPEGAHPVGAMLDSISANPKEARGAHRYSIHRQAALCRSVCLSADSDRLLRAGGGMAIQLPRALLYIGLRSPLRGVFFGLECRLWDS